MNKIMDFLSSTATAHADEKIVMTEGYYEDYYGEHVTSSLRSIRRIYDDAMAMIEAWEFAEDESYEPTTLWYRNVAYSDSPSVPGRQYRPLRNLPPGGSMEALQMLIQFCSQSFSELIDGGSVSLELERDVIERERIQRFNSLQSLAASILKDTGGENLFSALESRITAAEDQVYGIEEDGLCAVNPFASSAVNDYYDLRNEAAGRVASEVELFEFCRTAYPLSYMEWKESKLAEARI